MAVRTQGLQIAFVNEQGPVVVMVNLVIDDGRRNQPGTMFTMFAVGISAQWLSV